MIATTPDSWSQWPGWGNGQMKIRRRLLMSKNFLYIYVQLILLDPTKWQTKLDQLRHTQSNEKMSIFLVLCWKMTAENLCVAILARMRKQL